MLEEGLKRSYLADGFGKTARPENAHLDVGQLTKHCFLEISLCKVIFSFIIILLKKLKIAQIKVMFFIYDKWFNYQLTFMTIMATSLIAT